MDPLTPFGLAAVSLLPIFHASEARGPAFTPLFAASCRLDSNCNLLQGAWPFGQVEAVWAGVALRRSPRRAAGCR